jgi:hypothetical protein
MAGPISDQLEKGQRPGAKLLGQAGAQRVAISPPRNCY